MTSSLQRLLWAVALVIGLNQVLGMEDRLHGLEAERASAQALRSREEGVTQNVDWPAEDRKANAMRTAWMTRLPLYASPGLMLSGSLESAGAMCQELKLACQVSSLDDGAPVSTSTSASGTRPVPATPAAGPRKDAGAGGGMPGLSATGIKLSTPFQPEDLVALVKRLETADQLRRIERVGVAGSRMEFVVRLYAFDASRASGVSGTSANLAAKR